MITFSLLDRYNEVAHFCTSREGGASVGNYASFNLSPFTDDNPVHYSENRDKLSKVLDIDSKNIVVPFQNHGSEVRLISESFLELSEIDKSEYLHGVDALYTNLSGICIGVTTADCVPLLFFDPVKHIIAVAHAGWRGTCARIAGKTVQSLNHTFNCNPKDIKVVIGPSISPEVYEVGDMVIENFEKERFDIAEIFSTKNNSTYLDLWKANSLIVENEGVLPENIEIAGICTYTEHNRFFSARRLGIKSGRIMSGIMLKNS